MASPDSKEGSTLALELAAPQHGPRPLILFLAMLARETAGRPDRMTRALAGLRAYQEAPRRPAPEPPPAIAERHGALLRAYGGDGPPVLFVPSLINPPTVLDLAERSLLRWLAGRGHHVLLLDWGTDVAARAGFTIADHVTDILLPLAATIDPPPALVGYCLGGTMAIAAAALAPVSRLATIAAPWRFQGFPAPARAQMADLWARSQPAVQALGLLPMELLQSAFWSLDPGWTVAKFERFADLPIEGAKALAFVKLEDWANDGPPIGGTAAGELFEDFLARDLPGRGEWRVGGQVIDPAALPCPTFHILSTTDRIVPAASAPPGGERVELALGHVGMVVGSHAEEALWEPLDHWLSQSLSG
jgi:polyhydroxyalkanoate synthase